MQRKFVLFISAVFFLFFLASNVSAVTITDEDFEGGASGWSNNTTTTDNPNFTRFLGRFGATGGNQSVFKTYSLSGNQTEVYITFDFYEIDSWDRESFRVFIDDSVVINDSFQHARFDDPALAAPLLGTGFNNLGFSGWWSDQIVQYTFTANTTDTSLKIGFGSTLNQGISDESWGIDNVVISDNSRQLLIAPPGTNGVIPEPNTMLLLGAGLLGLAGFRRKVKKN